MKSIYIVVSQTGSIVAKLIRLATGDKYTHAAIGLDHDLQEMYTFGRRYPHNPVWGGFVKESPAYGTLKRFKNADIVAIRLFVEDEQYKEINDYIRAMYSNRKKFRYNYIGLFLAKLGIHYKRDNHYYCSEFVREILEKFNVIPQDEFDEVVRPADFLKLRKGEIVYRGKLCDFPVQA